MLVVQGYKDKSAWVADEKNVFEKIGEEKLGEWQKRWSKVFRKMEDREGVPHMDLSHFNE